VTPPVWPKRLLIAGALLIVIGSTVLYSGWEDLEAAMDPSENHVAMVAAGQTVTINLTEGHVYLAYRVDSSKANCTLTEVHTGAEISRASPGWLQSDRIGVDNQLYKITGTYTAEADGEHEIHNLDDRNSTLWIIDEQQIEGGGNTLLLLQVSCMTLLCGACMLPIGGTLWLTSRRQAGSANIVMQTAGGVQVPIAPGTDGVSQRVPTTDEVWASLRSGAPLDLNVPGEAAESQVPPPFADQPDGIAAQTRVIDEIQAVEEALTENPEIADTPAEEGTNWKSWDEG
jgi:hypothetical protein